ncbi:MAG: thiamine-phosphate kinase [Verrucomicrobiia bacterium]
MRRASHLSRTVGDVGEFGLIGQIQRQLATGPAPSGIGAAAHRSAVVGIGDDCAVLRSADRAKYLLYTCDPVVERVHYLPHTPPRDVGWKAMARNLSDIAAMGGQPRWAVVSVGLRRRTSVAYVRQLYDGLQSAAKQFGCLIVGGDCTHVRHEQFVAVALLGEVERDRLALRSGAKPGDVVFVTGKLGGSVRGKHLKFTPRIREARWLTGHFKIHAMMDISDGLASDLQRLLESSHVGFDISSEKIPVNGSVRAALSDGEDFELLFTISPRDAGKLKAKWRFKLPLTEIGRAIRQQAVLLDGQPLATKGYDHFAQRS